MRCEVGGVRWEVGDERLEVLQQETLNINLLRMTGLLELDQYDEICD